LSQPVEPQSGDIVSDESKSEEDLQKRIVVLERKAAREKKARNLAENQLEQYSLEIYEVNQSLKSALAFATQKQAELEYLGQASSDVASDLPLSKMIINVVELTGKFCSAGCGIYIVTEKGETVGGKLNQMWCLDQGWQEVNTLENLVKTTLPLNESKLLESWFVLPFEEAFIKNNESFNLLLYTNFALAGDKIGWLAFLSQSESVSEETLSVLTTARGHLLSGIQRRLTDVRILKRNVQLQDSLNSLEKARRQLIQSEKMASLGQLAAGVAHEINNPVAFIRSNMEVLKEYLNDYKLVHAELNQSVKKNQVLALDVFEKICQKVDLGYIEEDSEDLLQSNIEGLERVKDIVDNLKSFSHAGDEVLTEMSLTECIQGALKIAGNAFKYEHKVDNQLSGACPRIVGNLGQLQQVFVNLFVNAAYAMEGGGELSLSYTEVNERVIIHVKDTGIGMDKETINQLFTPFFTTKPVGVGTGLGLSVSYAILEAHEAQVTVDSEVDIGTTFNLSFPINT
jgi:signal transduction histidine kinase